MKYLIVALTFVLAMTSCSEDFFSTTLEIDPPAYTPQIVTHAFLNFDNKEINIQVSETTSITDVNNNGNNRSDAIVTLFNESDETQVIEATASAFSDFNFGQFNIITADNEYKLNVSVPGYDEIAFASQTIPSNVVIKDIVFKEDGGIDNEGDDRSAVNIVIEDLANEENFYEIFVMIANENNSYFTTFASSNDPVVSRGYNYNSILLSDATFNGEDKELKVQMYPITNAEAENRLFIKFRTVTKEYYQFSKTLERFDESKDNPFATPIQIYTNFENGIGVFSVFRERFEKVF